MAFIFLNSFIINNYLPETQAWLAELDVAPTPEQTVLVNTFIDTLKTGGIWSKLDCLYLFMMHDDQAARVNLINPGTDTLTKNNSPAFTANVGFTGGANAYLHTTTTIDSFTNYQQNDASFGLWVENSINQNTPAIGHTLNSSEIRPHAGGNCYSMINGSFYGLSYAVGDSLGLSAVSRPDSSSLNNYRNGVKQGSTVLNNSVALTATTFKILGGVSFNSAAQSSFAFLGASLTDDEMSDLYDAVAAYRSGVALL